MRGDIHSQFLNVLEGKTAHGQPANLPRLSFSKNPDVVDATVQSAELMLRVLALADTKLAANDDVRTAVIWKLATFVIRAGISPRDNGIFTIASMAAQYMADHPTVITGPTSLGSIVQRCAEERLQAANRNRRSEPLPVGSRDLMAFGRVPDPPVIATWHSGVELVELIHPVHLFMEGKQMGNCLSTHFEERPVNSPVPVTAPPALLRLTYWSRMVRKGDRIFSVRREDQSLACICVRLNGHVSDFDMVWSDDEDVVQAVADALIFLNRLLGPLLLETSLPPYLLERVKVAGELGFVTRLEQDLSILAQVRRLIAGSEA